MPDRFEIERVESALSKIDDLSYADLLKILARPVRDEPPGAAPPLPVAITEEQSRALARLQEVYGKVMPTERRELARAEVRDLMEERLVLDEIEGMTKKRKEDQRTIIFNHFDAGYDRAVGVDGEKDMGREPPPRNKDGHYVFADDEAVPELGKKFTREVRKGTVTMNPRDLEALVTDEEAKAEIRKALNDDTWDFTHKDFIALTVQTRLFDENKAMIALRKNPGLVAALGHVTKSSAPVVSFHIRKS